jgi:hypothetical protein
MNEGVMIITTTVHSAQCTVHAHTHTHTHSLAHTHSCTHVCAHSFTHSLTHSPTHTHTHPLQVLLPCLRGCLLWKKQRGTDHRVVDDRGVRAVHSRSELRWYFRENQDVRHVGSTDAAGQVERRNGGRAAKAECFCPFNENGACSPNVHRRNGATKVIVRRP